MSYKIQGSFPLRFLMSPNLRLVRHVCAITILVSLTLLSSDQNEKEYIGNVGIYVNFASFIWVLAPLYLNMYVIVPRLLLKGKLFTYILAVILLIILSFGILVLLERFLRAYSLNATNSTSTLWQIFLALVLIFSVILGASTAIKLFQQWLRDAEKMTEMQQASLRHELSQLKSQVNPHFLFNTLNNLQVLIEHQPVKATAVVNNLTRLLRYQLYEGARQLVPLQSDLDFLNDFLSLEMIRRENFSYEMDINGSPNMILIPHFLFIAFVENAVKHSYDPHHPSYVHITCEIVAEQLKFSCENSLPPTPYKQDSGGIGLNNITRRLELLYPGQHTLEQITTQTQYEVKLNIPI